MLNVRERKKNSFHCSVSRHFRSLSDGLKTQNRPSGGRAPGSYMILIYFVHKSKYIKSYNLDLYDFVILYNSIVGLCTLLSLSC